MEYLGNGKWENMEVHHHGGFKSSRPVAEGKVIKTVAKVAAVAAAVYYGGSFLAGAAGSGGATGAAGFMSQGAYNAGLAATGGTISAGTALSAGGLALQAVGTMQQQGAMGDMQDAENNRIAAANKVAESEQRQSDVAAQRARVAQVREARIRAAQVTASLSQAGGAGTSSLATGAGTIGTQMGANIGFINTQQSFAGEQSAANKEYGKAASDVYTAQNEMQGWSSVSALGKEISGGAGTAIKTIFSI
jgi:hypothetical protein